MNRFQVLLIDADENEASVTRSQLSDAAPGSFAFTWRRNPKEVLSQALSVEFDVIIVDLDLRDENALLDLSLLCRRLGGERPIIVWSAYGNTGCGLRAMQLGAEEYWLKGEIDPEILAASIFRAIERKKLEVALRREQTLLRGILDCMPDGVATADSDGNLTFFNRAASNLAGMGLQESKPDSWQQTYGIFMPDRVTPYPADETPLYRAINGQSVEDAHLFVRHAELPEGRLLSLNGGPIFDEEGQTVGGVVCFREVVNVPD